MRLVAALLLVGATACATGDAPNASPPATTRPPTTATSTTIAPAAPAAPVAPAVGDAAGSEGLATALDPLWSVAPGGCVTVARTDSVIYEIGASALVPPASAVKLVTAGAALAGLGADTRLETVARAAAAPTDGVVDGDLWLVGGGDPVLGTDAWAATFEPGSPHTSLDALADAVAAAGVRVVNGSVIGDESRFDQERAVPTWPPRMVEDGEAGPLSALVANDGFEVWGHPGVAFADPAAGAATLFVELLRARGVSVGGQATSGVASAGVDLATIESAPIGELVAAMLRDSDNGTAELLVKELGRRRAGEGSTAAGMRVVADLLRSQGVEVGDSVLADGSGLSEATRVSCRLLADAGAAWRTALDERLPVAGRDGTLRRRMLGSAAEGRLRAKTGSLDGVTSLAGFVESADGETLSFAVVVTGFPVGTAAGRDLVDATAVALASTSVAG